MISFVSFLLFLSSGWPVVRVQRFFLMPLLCSLGDGRHGSVTTVIETTTPLFRARRAVCSLLLLLQVHTPPFTVKATLQVD
jgi:hypothetical protein